MIIYVDGSSKQLVDSKNRWYSWGIYAINNDITYEVNGKMFVNDLRGHHEIVAFIEAVLFASSHNVSPEACSFYTDDEVIGYGHLFNQDRKYEPCKLGETLLSQVNLVCELFYDDVIKEKVISYLLNSKITKVKGHSWCTYNRRVDYLATCAMRGHNVNDFEYWLKCSSNVNFMHIKI